MQIRDHNVFVVIIANVTIMNDGEFFVNCKPSNTNFGFLIPHMFYMQTLTLRYDSVCRQPALQFRSIRTTVVCA